MDRAALDVALALGIPCGGWCPNGRRAEDGVIAAKYPLQETESRNYQKRTKLNVEDSDGTLILYLGELSGGTAYTARLADERDKPCLMVDLGQSPDPQRVFDWITAKGIRVLNVAGPRQEKCPGIGKQAAEFLQKVLEIA